VTVAGGSGTLVHASECERLRKDTYHVGGQVEDRAR
jgi:hypothetical protein